MTNSILDHPAVSGALRTGYPNGTPEYPVCPVCGEAADTLYKNLFGCVVGCDNCVTAWDAWEEYDDRKYPAF